MLLTPEAHPFDFKNPPRLVLGLSLLLLLIYLLWPRTDAARQAQLDTQYTQELLALEWPLYETHLLQSQQAVLARQLEARYQQRDFTPLARQLGADQAFVAQLQSSGRDYMEGDNYGRWAEARQRYDQEQRKLSSHALGLDAQQSRPITFITYQLINPELLPLLACLLLLLSAGLALELALGGMAVLGGFVLGGVGGGLIFLLLNSQSVFPLTGAGAGVGALVGMCLMQFRQQRLLLLGKTPLSVWALLGLWLLLPLASYFSVSQDWTRLLPLLVGLALGPLIWLLWERLKPDTEAEVELAPAVDNDQVYRENLDLALQAVSRMEFLEAKQRLRELVKAYPQDLPVLQQLYQVEKLSPDNDTFEAVARRLFNLSNTDDAAKVCLTIYRDYSKLSQSLRALDSDTSLKLVMRFARLGEVKEAEQLLKQVLAKTKQHSLLPKAAHALALAFDNLQDAARAEFYRDMASGKA